MLKQCTVLAAIVTLEPSRLCSLSIGSEDICDEFSGFLSRSEANF